MRRYWRSLKLPMVQAARAQVDQVGARQKEARHDHQRIFHAIIVMTQQHRRNQENDSGSAQPQNAFHFMNLVAAVKGPKRDRQYDRKNDTVKPLVGNGFAQERKKDNDYRGKEAVDQT